MINACLQWLTRGRTKCRHLRDCFFWKLLIISNLGWLTERGVEKQKCIVMSSSALRRSRWPCTKLCPKFNDQWRIEGLWRCYYASCVLFRTSDANCGSRIKQNSSRQCHVSEVLSTRSECWWSVGNLRSIFARFCIFSSFISAKLLRAHSHTVQHQFKTKITRMIQMKTLKV